jgi:hypothetical protein
MLEEVEMSLIFLVHIQAMIGLESSTVRLVALVSIDRIFLNVTAG